MLIHINTFTTLGEDMKRCIILLSLLLCCNGMQGAEAEKITVQEPPHTTSLKLAHRVIYVHVSKREYYEDCQRLLNKGADPFRIGYGYDTTLETVLLRRKPDDRLLEMFKENYRARTPQDQQELWEAYKEDPHTRIFFKQALPAIARSDDER